mgnify:CR=1 FL=1
MEEVSSVREEISSVRKEGAEARVKMKEQFGLQPDFSQEPTLGMYTACALRVRCVCAACALRVRCICTACALHVYHLFHLAHDSRTCSSSYNRLNY